MAKHTKLVSHFPQAKRAARDGFQKAIELGTNVMEGEAEKRLERIDDTRGYELPIDIQQETSDQEGRIFYPHFYGRFFEYGTVYIPASPFMKGAHRKGKKAFLDEVHQKLDGYIQRRAGI